MPPFHESIRYNPTVVGKDPKNIGRRRLGHLIQNRVKFESSTPVPNENSRCSSVVCVRTLCTTPSVGATRHSRVTTRVIRGQTQRRFIENPCESSAFELYFIPRRDRTFGFGPPPGESFGGTIWIARQ